MKLNLTVATLFLCVSIPSSTPTKNDPFSPI
ncbi:MAG: hypothetical protein ACD_16C00089G0001, partial [uncultured bacterium]